MYKAGVPLSIFCDFTLALTAMVHPEGSTATRSETVVLAHLHVRPQVVGSVSSAMQSAWCHGFAKTLPAYLAANENTVCADETDETLNFHSRSPTWVGSDKALKTLNSSSVRPTILFSQQWQESCTFPNTDAASLRRLTKPLRGFIRRRLARGACRPPSIPPVSAASERVHACAWVGTAP